MTTQLLTTCPDCGDTYEADELTTVWNEGNKTKVCQACIDNDYRLCEGCREYIYRHDFDGNPELCTECHKKARKEQAEALYEQEMERRFDEWRLEGRRFG